MAYLGFIPTATILPYAGANAPEGWLVCDGQEVSRTTFASLYAALGGAASPFGQGNGSTTFNLPDLRGRFPRFDNNMGNHGIGGVTATGASTRDPGRTHGSTQTQTTAKNSLSGTATGQTLAVNPGPGGTAVSLSGGDASLTGVNLTHSHTVEESGFLTPGAINISYTAGGTGFYARGQGGLGVSNSSNLAHSHTVTGKTEISHGHPDSGVTITGDTETRPINIALNAIIKI